LKGKRHFIWAFEDLWILTLGADAAAAKGEEDFDLEMTAGAMATLLTGGAVPMRPRAEPEISNRKQVRAI